MQEIPDTQGQINEVTPPTSLGARMMNVFISPGEVFDEVKASPYQTGNWLVPIVLAVIAGIIFSLVVFSQPQIIRRMREPAENKVQQLVDQGKLTRQQADQQLEVMEKFMSPAFFRFSGIVGSLLFSGVMLLVVALAVWLLGTLVFKGVFTYGKAVEGVGLATMITVPGALVAMCLAVIYGNISMTPGPALLIGNFDPHNRVHLLLSTMNVFMLWYLAVVAIGMSRLSGASFWKCACCGYALWAVIFVAPTVFLGGLK